MIISSNSPDTSSSLEDSAFSTKAFQHFFGVLQNYYQEIGCAHDDQSRFLVQLRYMFQDLVFPYAYEFSVYQRSGDRVFDMEDNLDTGNSSFQPFNAITRELQQSLTDVDFLRKYLGPRAAPRVEESLRNFLAKIGLYRRSTIEQSTICLGAGTVHLYDLLVRFLIRRPGDVVILPSIGYGFFIPQIDRCGGSIEWLSLNSSNGFKASHDKLKQQIYDTNARLYSHWSKLLASLLLSLLENETKRTFTQSEREEYAKMVKRAKNALDFEEMLSQFCLQVGLPSWPVIATSKEISRHLPARVVAFLHINPSVQGVLYNSDEVKELVNVCHEFNVTLIEDLAFALMPLNDDRQCLTSALEYSDTCVSLVGLSKPFGIASLRVGALLSRRMDMALFLRYIEGSIGYLSELCQRAIFGLADAPVSSAKKYLADVNQNADWSYRKKRDLLLRLINGCPVSQLPDELSEFIFRQVREFGQASRNSAAFGTISEILGPQLPSFLEKGLSDWLETEVIPEYGMFLVVRCDRFITTMRHCGIKLENSFDLFAFLAYFCGVRTIPEETMGLLPNESGVRLRISYSTSARALVWSCIAIFLGITALMNLEERNGTC